MGNAVEDILDAGALQALLTEQLRVDAQAVFKDMQSPAVMRIRAEAAEPASFRLLTLRLARMGTARNVLKQHMLALIEHRLPLEREQQRNVIRADVRRALEACIRVLESTDSKETTKLVAENAEGMNHSIGTMATLLSQHLPDFAHELAEESLRASEIARNVDAIANEMRHAYEQVRAEIAKTGPRVSSSTGATAEVASEPMERAASIR